MNTEHTTNWRHSKPLFGMILGLIAVGVIYLFVVSVIQDRLDDFEVQTRLLIADQQATLVAIAEATARNGADAVTESIIRDCSVTERSQFETLLGQLNNGLSNAELVSLERLFGRCGGFYAQRKALMASRLNREIEVYKTYISQLNTITGEDLSSAFYVTEWETLADEEQRQSDLFAQLVSSQDKIIQALLNGTSPASAEMQEILQQAQTVKETLIVTNKQAANIRTGLVPL